MDDRFDLYTPIHKALRVALVQVQCRLGSTDWTEPAERLAALEEAAALLQMMSVHLHHENDFVHPELEALAPGSSARVAGEHQEHERSIRALEDEMAALRGIGASQAAAAGLALYRHFSAFVAHNLEHMLLEESEENARLWAGRDDAALIALHDRLMASIPVPEMIAMLRWMAQGLNVSELAELLNSLRPQPEVFEASREEILRWLDAPRGARLCSLLSPAAAPGLAAA